MLKINISGNDREQTRRSFRKLRSKIALAGAEYKTIAVICNDAEKYRTQITANLALSMADTGKRCLMILAEPGSEEGIVPKRKDANTAGLFEYLNGSKDFQHCIQKTQYNNLDVIISGSLKDGSADLLEGERFKALLGSAKEEYDQVLVDLPSIDQVPGSIVTAGYCDASLLVLSGTVSLKRLQKTVRMLSENSSLLGAIRV